MLNTDAPVSVPTNQTLKKLIADRAFREGVPASEVVRQAIDQSIATNRAVVGDIGKPFLSARLTPAQQQHLRRVAQQTGVSHQTALEAIMCDFLFGEAPAQEADNEPDLFD